MKNNIEEILKYLDELFPNPKCELNYNKDYELLIATMLSAQTTDKRVNLVTEILFKKYPNLEKLSQAKIEDIIKDVDFSTPYSLIILFYIIAKSKNPRHFQGELSVKTFRQKY